MNKQILYKYNPSNEGYFVFKFNNFYKKENKYFYFNYTIVLLSIYYL